MNAVDPGVSRRTNSGRIGSFVDLDALAPSDASSHFSFLLIACCLVACLVGAFERNGVQARELAATMLALVVQWVAFESVCQIGSLDRKVELSQCLLDVSLTPCFTFTPCRAISAPA